MTVTLSILTAATPTGAVEWARLLSYQLPSGHDPCPEAVGLLPVEVVAARDLPQAGDARLAPQSAVESCADLRGDHAERALSVVGEHIQRLHRVVRPIEQLLGAQCEGTFMLGLERSPVRDGQAACHGSRTLTGCSGDLMAMRDDLVPDSLGGASRAAAATTSPSAVPPSGTRSG